MIKKIETGAATTKKSGKTSTREIREMPLKKLSCVLNIQMKNQGSIVEGAIAQGVIAGGAPDASRAESDNGSASFNRIR